MAELLPAPLGNLLRRVHGELALQDTLFDLSSKAIYRGDPALDTSIDFLGRRAATPVGPAAGPHSQLAQNIVLAWLAGSRCIELKTVQVLDRLELPRPCIWAGNIGLNVEWSQELRLADSLREYVKASMIVDILRHSRLAGERPGPDRDDTVFDMSVGYDLKGIRSPEVTGWMLQMRDATAIIDELRSEIPGELAHYREFDFQTRVSDTLTLSTFHGCPAGEIEQIVRYLLVELGLDTVIKLNPTLLGKQRVDHLLHDVLGYSELLTSQDAFEKDLQFEDAIAMVSRLTETARAHGRRLGVKFTNTLIVQNHMKYFSDPVMYLSGPPLHVISLTLAQSFREVLGFDLPVSFSAGIDRHNFADVVACGFTPVTTCTDLLKTGGYGRLSGYLTDLEARMKGLGARTVDEFILGTARAQDADVGKAARTNLAALVERTQANPRYGKPRNQALPRKLGSKLFLFDCINCDKCVPVCPNNANFSYEIPAMQVDYRDLEFFEGSVRQVGELTFRVGKSHQIANFSDFCNECGNCDMFCPEEGGPFVMKPRWFGSLEAWRRHCDHDGFHLTQALQGAGYRMHGRIGGHEFLVDIDPASDRAIFQDTYLTATLGYSSGVLHGCAAKPATPPGHRLEMSRFYIMKCLFDGVTNSAQVNHVNVGL